MMSAIAAPTVRPSISAAQIVTPDELLKLEEQGLFELVDGRLLEKKMAFNASEAAGKIVWALSNFIKELKLAGFVLPEQTFQCFPHKPNQVRRPDVAFIHPSRVPTPRPTGHIMIAPDLAVEVVSPTDNVYELDKKLAEYRVARIPLVWVVNPEERVATVRRLGKPIDELYDGDLLTGDPALPGFSANVTDLLPAMPSAPAETAR